MIFSSCATHIRPKENTAPAEIYPRHIPMNVLVELEELSFKVKQNNSDLGKYFELDENGQIIAKADFQDRQGDYEVVYDLTNAKVIDVPSADNSSADNPSYEIGFSILKKSAGVSLGDKLIWKPGAGSEGILLAFDDDFIEVWEQYFDLLDRYNSKVTFFVQNAWDPDRTGPFCNTALERGHSIGFHTINHPDLRKVSEETFFAETIEPLDAYRNAGITVSSFAYPFGFSEPWMHGMLHGYYGVLRGYGVTYRIYHEDDIRSGYIIAKAIDNTVIRGEDNFRKTVLSMLRTLKFLGDSRILPLTTHDISDRADYGITAQRLEFLLKSVSELGLKFYDYDDFQ